MRIAITGATGFIGSTLSKYLRICGFDVIDFVRSPINSNQVKIDLNWKELPKNYLKNIDVLIHCAATVHKKNNTKNIFNQNTKVTDLLINSAIENGVKGVYFISTVGVFGRDYSNFAISDLTEPNPQNDYSKSKLAAEHIVNSKCSSNNIPFNTIRLPLILGTYAPGTFGTLLKAIGKGIPFPFKGIENKRSILLIDDLVRCVGHMLKNGIYINDSGIMCQPVPMSTSEIVIQGGNFLSKDVMLFKFPKVFFEYFLNFFKKSKIYNQLFESLEFHPHPEFKKVFDAR